MKLTVCSKKLLSAALATAMMFSLCGTAWAEDTGSATANPGGTVQQVEGDVSTWESAQGDTGSEQEPGATDTDATQPDSTAPADPAQVPATLSLTEDAQPASTEKPFQVGDASYSTWGEAIEAVGEGGTITLTADATDAITDLNGKTVTLDLGGHALTMSNKTTVYLKGGANLTIQNGSVKAVELLGKSGAQEGTVSLFNVQTNSSIRLNKVNLDTTGAALFPQGDAATVSVVDSTINAGVYAVGTNAATVENYNVKIDLKNSTFTCTHGYNTDFPYDSCIVMINVPGTLIVDNCKIDGSRQGVLVRGGTATIRNSVITDSGAHTGGIWQHLDKNWQSGNEVPMAALIVGNRSNSYPYPATCTVENTTITSQSDQVPAIYTYGMEDDGNDRTVTLTITGGQTNVQGAISNNGKATTEISGGTFSTDPTGLLADEYKVTTVDGKYVVSKMEPVAQIGETTYTSVAKAVEAAGADAAIQLLANTSEDVTIPEDKTITLDLCGHTLTNVSGHTITNNGTLTVKDTVGGGTVDNTTHGKAAVFNESGATATLESGTYTRSQEAGNASSANGNSYYVVLNFGTMTIEDGTTVIANGSYSSLIDNNNDGSLTVNGGTLKGGLNALKNDEGTITVNGGTLQPNDDGQQAILNWDNAVINGGNILSKNYIAFYNYETATINGGTFTTESKQPAVYNCIYYAGTAHTKADLSIEDGTFVSQGQYSVYSTYQLDATGTGNIGPVTTIHGGNYTGTVYCRQGSLSITDGNFPDSVFVEKIAGGYLLSPATLTIEGGTFGSPIQTSDSYVAVTISGGKFSDGGTGDCLNIQYSNTDAVNVSGGYFTTKVNSDYIAEGKACNLLDALYEGVYAYQVGEKSEDVAAGVEIEVEAPTVEAGEVATDSIPEVDGVNTAELATDLNTAANSTSITDETAGAVSNAVLVEAKVNGQKITTDAVKTFATEELRKKLGEGDSLKEDGDITITVEPVLKVTPLAPEVEDGAYKRLPFDIELLYQVTASAETTNASTVEADLLDATSLPAVENPPVMDIMIKNVPLVALGYDASATPESIASTLYVRHDHQGGVYYYRPTVSQVTDGKIAEVIFTNEYGFSRFTMMNDDRSAAVQFPSATPIYNLASIGTGFPVSSMPGMTFDGWKFEGVAGGPYKTLTDELLTLLSNAYEANGKTTIKANATYTPISTDSDSTGGSDATTAQSSSNSTVTAQQSGGSTAYYTCPACGYHDWTAAADGYKCDHCGYTESVKQLSGYGNVKGIYEPKTSAAADTAAAAAATVSAVPQTSDDLPLTGLIILAVAALLGLGVSVVLKKRDQ